MNNSSNDDYISMTELFRQKYTFVVYSHKINNILEHLEASALEGEKG